MLVPWPVMLENVNGSKLFGCGAEAETAETFVSTFLLSPSGLSAVYSRARDLEAEESKVNSVTCNLVLRT